MDNNPYLGLILSKDLKRSAHIEKKSRKASPTPGFIQRNLKKCPSQVKKRIYCAWALNGETVWDPYHEKDIYKLEKIQRKAARFITNDYKSREKRTMNKMLNELELQS